MAQPASFTIWDRVSANLASRRFRNLLVFIALCLFLYYVLYRQQQRFSELRMPSGIIPKGHAEH